MNNGLCTQHEPGDQAASRRGHVRHSREIALRLEKDFFQFNARADRRLGYLPSPRDFAKIHRKMI
jgi:hypothetical protein